MTLAGNRKIAARWKSERASQAKKPFATLSHDCAKKPIAITNLFDERQIQCSDFGMCVRQGMLAWQEFVKILQLPKVAGAPLLVERQLPVALATKPRLELHIPLLFLNLRCKKILLAGQEHA